VLVVSSGRHFIKLLENGYLRDYGATRFIYFHEEDEWLDLYQISTDEAMEPVRGYSAVIGIKN